MCGRPVLPGDLIVDIELPIDCNCKLPIDFKYQLAIGNGFQMIIDKCLEIVGENLKEEHHPAF